jgi:hypothetical protein
MDDETYDAVSYTVRDIIIMHRMLKDIYRHVVSLERLGHEAMMDWQTDTSRLLADLPLLSDGEDIPEEDVWQ